MTDKTNQRKCKICHKIIDYSDIIVHAKIEHPRTVATMIQESLYNKLEEK